MGEGAWLALSSGLNGNQKTLFLFTGQCSEFRGMGYDLYEANDALRLELNKLESRFIQITDDSFLSWISSKMLPVIETEAPHSRSPETRLQKRTFPQVALLALQWGLVEVLRSRNVKPTVLLGSDTGEVCAASVSGYIAKDDAMFLALERGRLLTDNPVADCTTMSVPCNETEVMASLQSNATEIKKMSEDVRLGAFHGPFTTTLRGRQSAVKGMIDILGVAGHDLGVLRTFNSRHAHEMERSLKSALESVNFGACQLPLSSTVTGRLLHPGGVIDVCHWSDQMCSPLRFHDAALESTNLHGEEGNQHVLDVIEIGPSQGWEGRRMGLETSGSDLPWRVVTGETRNSAQMLSTTIHGV